MYTTCRNKEYNKKEKIDKFCNSFFIEKNFGVINTPLLTFGNVITTGLNLGTNLIDGNYAVSYKLDKDAFENFILKNDLIEMRELILYANNNNIVCDKLDTLTKADIDRKVKEREARFAKEVKEKKERDARLAKKKKICKNIENKISLASGTEIIKLYNELDKHNCK